jgi:hypothetical protein
MLSLHLPLAGGDAVAPDDGFAPNALIRIGSGGQGLLTMPCVEMGQGTYTSIPMLIAEELEVRIARMTHLPVAGTRFLLRVKGRRTLASESSQLTRGELSRLIRAGASASCHNRTNRPTVQCRSNRPSILAEVTLVIPHLQVVAATHLAFGDHDSAH